MMRRRRMGMGGGSHGARWVADLVGAAGIATLPSGLAFARSAGTAYGQDSASTLYAATANQPRRIYTPAGNGLLLCRATTNQLLNSAVPGGTGWSAGTAAPTSGVTGPDGTASGSRCTIASAGYGPFQSTANSNGVPVCLSAWLLRGAAVDGPHHGLVNATPVIGIAQTATAIWTPWTVPGSIGAAATYGIPWDGRALGGMSASAVDTAIAFLMLENTAYRRMPVVTPSGSTATIAGDVLSHPTASTMIVGGRLALRVRFIPQGDSSQLVAAGMLWYVDASNFAQVTTARKVAITIAGTTFTAPGLANWLAYDVVDIFVIGGGGTLQSEAWLSVNGGAGQLLGVSGAAQGTIPSGGAIYFGCASDASGQLDAAFQRIEAW